MEGEKAPLTSEQRSLVQKAIEKARAYPLSCQLWFKSRKSRPMDTFIGLINTRDWIFYFAPTFGIPQDLALRIWKTDEIAQHEATIKGNVLKILDDDVVSSPTSADRSLDSMVSVVDVESEYGSERACYVVLRQANDFDGRSHRALAAWIRRNADGNFDISRSLGFSIQRDSSGWYIRFASNLNLFQGNQLMGTASGPKFSATFEPRTPDSAKHYGNREPRDLPKQWAHFVESVLVKELKLAVLESGPKHFDRITSRGERQTSKISRFKDIHLEHKHPGTAGTGNRIV
jgi:hypothetical protein